VNGSSSWPTAQAHDVRERGNTEADHHYKPHDLSNAAQNWPTPDTAPEAPNSGSNKKSGPPGLGNAAALWATPRATEYKDAGPLGSKSHAHRLARHYLDAQSIAFDPMSGPPDPATALPGPASLPSAPTSPRPRLDPRFVVWLMGLPEGWLDLDGPTS
jgi:hypothetical protein